MLRQHQATFAIDVAAAFQLVSKTPGVSSTDGAFTEQTLAGQPWLLWEPLERAVTECVADAIVAYLPNSVCLGRPAHRTSQPVERRRTISIVQTRDCRRRDGPTSWSSPQRPTLLDGVALSAVAAAGPASSSTAAIHVTVSVEPLLLKVLPMHLGLSPRLSRDFAAGRVARVAEDSEVDVRCMTFPELEPAVVWGVVTDAAMAAEGVRAAVRVRPVDGNTSALAELRAEYGPRGAACVPRDAGEWVILHPRAAGADLPELDADDGCDGQQTSSAADQPSTALVPLSRVLRPLSMVCRDVDVRRGFDSIAPQERGPVAALVAQAGTVVSDTLLADAAWSTVNASLQSTSSATLQLVAASSLQPTAAAFVRRDVCPTQQHEAATDLLPPASDQAANTAARTGAVMPKKAVSAAKAGSGDTSGKKRTKAPKKKQPPVAAVGQ